MLIKLIKELYLFNEKEIEEIKNSLYQTYAKFNIKDINSLYRKSTVENIFVNKTIIENDKFPTIKDFIDNVKNEKIKEIFVEKFINRFSCLSNITNFDINKYFNRAIFFGIKELNEQEINVITNYMIEIIDLNITSNLINKTNIKSILYFDEIWKYFRGGNNKNLSNRIFELYKTIRKKNAGIVAITQDISDFFAFENGNYGKSILNNSSFKLFFKLDYEDTEILQKLTIMNENTLNEIFNLEKGQVLLFINNYYFCINVKANDYEYKILGEENDENISSFE